MRRRYYDYPFKGWPALNGALAGIAVMSPIVGYALWSLWRAFQ